MKWLLRGLVSAAISVSICASLFTLIEAPRSLIASSAYVSAASLISKDPRAGVVADLFSISAFPFEAAPRFDAYTFVGELARHGIDVGDEMSDRLYKISIEAGGHAPLILSSRLYWLIFTGRAAIEHKAEALELIAQLKIMVPTLTGLDAAAEMLK